MPYVQRDESGKIVSVSDKGQYDNQEFLSINHPELLLFLSEGSVADPAKYAFSASDNELVRVIEDLVDLLVEKQIITYTDLPDPARQKLHFRTKLRGNLESLDNLIVDEEDII